MENESPNRSPQHQVDLNEDPYFDAFRPRVELDENIPKSCDLHADNIVFDENDVYPFDALISEGFGENDPGIDFPAANLLEDFGERGGTADSASNNYVDECISLYGILPAAEGLTGKLELSEFKATPSLTQSPKSDAIFSSSENSCASLSVAQHPISSDCDAQAQHPISSDSDAQAQHPISSDSDAQAQHPISSDSDAQAQHPISSDYNGQIELPENTVENDQQIKESGTMPNDEAIKSPTVITEVEQDVTSVTPSEVELNADLVCINLEPEEELKENADKPPDELPDDASKHDENHPHTVPTLAPGDFGERDGSSDATNLHEEPETADQLKEKAKHLIITNRVLSHKMNTSMKSLENQNKEIKYLQQTILSMHRQTTRQREDLCTLLGAATSRALDNITYYKALINCVSENRTLKASDRKHMNELLEIVSSVPVPLIESAQEKFADLQRKIEMRERNRCYREEQPSTSKGPKSREREEQNVREAQAKKFPNMQNLKKNAQKRKKKAQANESCSNNEHDAYNMKISLPSTSKASEQMEFPSGENLKKKAQKRKKKAQANESGSNSENGALNKKISLPSSSKASGHYLEEMQPSKQNIKEKAQNPKDEEAQANNVNVTSNKKISMKKSKATKKMQSTSDSNNEMNELKELVVVLSDFMIDPSADENQYIAQYKQEHFHARNDEEADHVGEEFKKKLSK